MRSLPSKRKLVVPKNDHQTTVTFDTENEIKAILK